MFEEKELNRNVLNFLDYQNLKKTCLLSKYFLKEGRQEIIYRLCDDVISKLVIEPRVSIGSRELESIFQKMLGIEKLMIRFKMESENCITKIITTKLFIIKQSLDYIQSLYKKKCPTEEEIKLKEKCNNKNLSLKERSQALQQYQGLLAARHHPLEKEMMRWRERERILHENMSGVPDKIDHQRKPA